MPPLLGIELEAQWYMCQKQQRKIIIIIFISMEGGLALSRWQEHKSLFCATGLINLHSTTFIILQDSDHKFGLLDENTAASIEFLARK